MNKFGESSTKKLNTCHSDIQKVMKLAIKECPIDFGIAEGERTLIKQQEYYAAGKSRLDGVRQKSKHQSSPSNAVDIYAYVNGKASWDMNHLCFIAGYIFKSAQELNIKIRWGGNWNGDGEIITGQSFVDAPHFELITN